MLSSDSGNLNPGQTYSHIFTMAGNYSYFRYHQGMEGEIIVQRP
jgi:plastocyanin